MSGFEIAGIVLATLPLLTPIVQNTIRSLSTRRYDQQLQKVIRNLKTEQVNLQNFIERLLDGLVPSSQIQTMIDDPLGDLWWDKKTVLNIRGRLWDRAALETFETTMQSIKGSVDELHEKLKSHSSSKASLLNRARFQFSDYERTIADIRIGVASLMTLTSDSITMEPSRRVRSQGPYLTFMQTISQSLYRAVRAGLPCQPHCRHGVGLRLEARKSVLNPLGNKDEIMQSLEFEVAISNAPASEGAALLWQEILVKAAVATTSTGTTATTTTTTTITAAATTTVAEPSPWRPARPAFPARLKSALAPSKKPRVTGSVSFGSPKVPSSPASTSAGTSTSTVTQTAISPAQALALSLPATPVPSAETSISLCLKAISDSQLDGHCTILDGSKRYAVEPGPLKVTWDTGVRSAISLREVLDRKESFFLSYRDRLQMAVTISSSVLQLYGSPWLSNDALSSNDIYFFVNGQTKSKHRDGEVTVLVEDPFIITCDGSGAPIIAVTSSAGKVNITSKTTAPALAYNKTLLSLGCVLLELISNESDLKLFHHSPTLASDGTVTGTASTPNYLSAHRALLKVVFPSDNYRGAISRCLQGSLHKPGQKFESDDYCQEVYSKVVWLLEKDLENA